MAKATVESTAKTTEKPHRRVPQSSNAMEQDLLAREGLYCKTHGLLEPEQVTTTSGGKFKCGIGDCSLYVGRASGAGKSRDDLKNDLPWEGLRGFPLEVRQDPKIVEDLKELARAKIKAETERARRPVEDGERLDDVLERLEVVEASLKRLAGWLERNTDSSPMQGRPIKGLGNWILSGKYEKPKEEETANVGYIEESGGLEND